VGEKNQEIRKGDHWLGLRRDSWSPPQGGKKVLQDVCTAEKEKRALGEGTGEGEQLLRKKHPNLTQKKKRGEKDTLGCQTISEKGTIDQSNSKNHSEQKENETNNKKREPKLKVVALSKKSPRPVVNKKRQSTKIKQESLRNK